MFSPRRVLRPQTGLINRHRAVIVLLMEHPSIVSANFEALSILDSGDPAVESLKKALIDAVIRDPDLDAPALRYHLNGLGFEEVIATVVEGDIKGRLPFDPASLSSNEAGRHLEELLELVGGSSGLFSHRNIPKS